MKIAIDADGVLVDYREAYGRAWERAFGEKPKIKHPEGYHATHYWDVPILDDKEYRHFSRAGFCEEIWETIPMLDGALEACEMLQIAGFELHCVTAIPSRLRPARIKNLESHGFKFTDVHACGDYDVSSPKLQAIKKLNPVAFIDDYIGYMQGVDHNTWKALIDVHPHKSPNRIPGYQWSTQPDSRHPSLLHFAQFWIANKP